MGKRNPFGADILPDEEKEMIANLEKPEKLDKERKERLKSEQRKQSDDNSMDSFVLGATTGVVVGPQSGIGASVYWSSHSASSDSSSSSSDSSSYSSD
jgi:hypothetical protein